MSFFGQGNFRINHEYRDFLSDVQRNSERIGDVGKVSDDFKQRGYDMFHQHGYHDLAKNQDKFIAPDEMYGTRGRENNRNYNRMEYDTPERHDGNAHVDVMRDVYAKDDKNDINIDNLLHAFEKMGYTLCSTASAVKEDPIVEKDYKDQIIL